MRLIHLRVSFELPRGATEQSAREDVRNILEEEYFPNRLSIGVTKAKAESKAILALIEKISKHSPYRKGFEAALARKPWDQPPPFNSVEKIDEWRAGWDFAFNKIRRGK